MITRQFKNERIIATAFLITLIAILPVSAATTQLYIVRYANDNITVLNETNVSYQWLEANLPVLGDGITHYYHQGPVFKDNPDPVVEEQLRWNPEEDTNVQEKDMGAVKGTNLRDLCDLVGGMSPGEEVKILSSDGWNKWLAYTNVYEYSTREGPLGICWYKDGQYPDNGYNDGMRMVWFADTSVNPWGIHAFGNWDWHEAAESKYWYYYQGEYPSTTGLSGQYVNRIYIFSKEPPPVAPTAYFTSDTQSGTAPLTVHFTDQSSGAPTSWAWDFTNDGIVDSSEQNPSHTYSTAGTYTVNLTVTGAGRSDSAVMTDFITITAPAITEIFDGTVTLSPDSTFNVTAYNSQIEYTENSATPLGALDTASEIGTGFTYSVSDKNFGTKGILLLDEIDLYWYNKTASLTWICQVNGVTLDDYGSPNTDGFNIKPLADGDQVNFYFGPKPVSPESATAVVMITVDIPPPGPVVDTIFDGTVTLSPDSTFDVTAYNSQTEYTVNSATPLGALDAASNAGTGFTYSVGDKNFGTKGILLLDEIDSYWYNKTASLTWICQVNGVTLDDYGSPATDGFNIKPLADGDQVNFYFGEKPVTPESATAIVRITVDIPPPGPVVDTIFDGTVTLSEDSTFDVDAYNSGTGYTVNSVTPLGALDAASETGTGFTYSVSDKNFGTKGILLLDEIGSYWYNKTAGLTWICQVNGVTLDDYGSPATDGFNIKPLSDGDQVNFYFGPKPVSSDSATAVVKITVDISGTGPVEPDWELSLSGARDQAVTRTYFEQGLACASSGHLVTWTDIEGNVWGGVPLWLLVGMVDDNPDSGPDHFNFNDALAAEGYSIKVTAGDGYNVNFESADIARNNDYIVANSLNGTPLPILKPNSTKPCFPLQLIGPAVSSGKLIGNITTIELIGIPEPSEGWTLTMEGEIVDTITQAYFEEALACIHTTTWTDGDGNVWSGIPLWALAGAVDDIETSSHWTFNDTLASSGYTIRVMAGDGYNRTFSSSDVAHSGNYLVANVKNGQPLSGNEAPLRLVGTNATGGKSIGNIATIRLEGLPGYPEGDWDLLLDGAIRDTIPQPEFEYWASCHSATYTDGDGNVYAGVPLWRLMGWVDDRIPHGPNGFNNTLANAGYTVIVTAGDGYSKEFTSQEIGTTNGFIIANRMNGLPLPTDGSHPPYPLRLVGAGLPSVHYSVGNIEKIELTEFQEPTEIPQIHIIKYDADGVTIINETTVDHVWMEAHLPVVGDGITHYMYQGVTLDPADLWDPTETKGMNPPKIDNAIKGTRVSDLCDLVGGMEPGTEITFVATDGWETTLPYDCIYTNPHVYSNLGDTIIAWYADGKYVPQYGDGPRLFFTPEDHVTGQWNMHEALAQQYWHYYWDAGVQYPSVAGLSAKYIATIRIYASPVSDWTLVLDGEALGGLNETITRNYFESALACQFGADHKAAYTDSQGRIWEGMPLWFLCGFIDDADQHSDHAYNETRALEGYRIIVTASDGYNYTFDSRDTVRNANYIVANTLNGSRIPEGDSSWPLRLVGQNVTGAKVVKGISSVVLIPSSVTPVADFTTTPLTGSAPLPVQFTDLSTGESLNWAWDFQDDGTIDSTVQNPLFTYQVPGTYSVRLTVTNAGGSDSEVKGNYITVTAPPVPPVAAFTSDIQSGQAPLTVQFTDLSTGEPVNWAWDFQDDGIIDSTVQNPLFTYQVPGTYSVRLTVANAEGSDVLLKNQFISVTIGPPTAAFIANPESGNWPLIVSFTDTSTGHQIQSWEWDFGDGKKANKQNPGHTFLRPGTYTVTLTVKNQEGTNATSRVIQVKGDFSANAVIKSPVAVFSQSSIIGTPPLSVEFFDRSLKNATSWLWDFGDESTSTEQNPVHTYEDAGTYTVKLKVANEHGISSAIKRILVTPRFSFFSH